jgi:very-short-patch-repair endonuclease
MLLTNSRLREDSAQAIDPAGGLLWRPLKGRKLAGLHFRKQHPIGPYVLDFYCDAVKLAVEVDGQSHGVADRPERDKRRDLWLAQKEIRTLRISAATVLEDVGNATRTILSYLDIPAEP